MPLPPARARVPSPLSPSLLSSRAVPAAAAAAAASTNAVSAAADCAQVRFRHLRPLRHVRALHARRLRAGRAGARYAYATEISSIAHRYLGEPCCVPPPRPLSALRDAMGRGRVELGSGGCIVTMQFKKRWVEEFERPGCGGLGELVPTRQLLANGRSGGRQGRLDQTERTWAFEGLAAWARERRGILCCSSRAERGMETAG
eukprot:208276-Pleurochrysis_carterae.AAC.6